MKIISETSIGEAFGSFGYKRTYKKRRIFSSRKRLLNIFCKSCILIQMLTEMKERINGALRSAGESARDVHERFGNQILRAAGFPSEILTTTKQEKDRERDLQRRKQLGEQLLNGELGWMEFEEQAGITDFVLPNGEIVKGETPEQRLERERRITEYLER